MMNFFFRHLYKGFLLYRRRLLTGKLLMRNKESRLLKDYKITISCSIMMS